MENISADRREFLTSVINALEGVQERIALIDTVDNWHFSMLQLFGTLNDISGLVLNAANAEVLRLNEISKKEKPR